MRAVNLLPSDLRGAAPKLARSARPEPVQGIGAYVLLGALALCVAAFAGYVLTTNGIKQREADLEAVKQRTAAATAKAAALKPYADFQALAAARVETVRGLAAARFDWERALRDVSHAIPGDVKLSALNGDMGLPGSTAASTGGGDALRGSIQAPAISMTGCAPTQTGVARMMARIKGVDGVTRVSLSKSEVAATATASTTTGSTSVCEGKTPATFSIVIFFERAAALDAYSSSAAAAAASTATVPVPNAVNQAGGAANQASGTSADGSTAPAGTDPAAQPPATSSTSTPTSTTAGGTP
jgi:Tfp pilus assembly protein PilN